MAETDIISEADRMERASLERTVSDVERQLLSLPPGTRPFFNGFLLNAKARLGVLEKKIHDEEREHQEHSSNEVAVAALAQKESALNEKEKETYSGFLREDFFTKKDFGRLEQFYAQTWDRLSEGGKDQMSHRVWEGIRRDEYKFTDLPKVVQEKEAERAYSVLKKRETGIGTASRIPQVDREDFIRAYENGKHDDAREILGRDSFRENMSLGATSKEKKDIAATHGREADGSGVETKASIALAKAHDLASPKSSSNSAIDLSALNLDGVKLAEAPVKVSSTDIPSATVSTPKGASLLRGG